MRGFFRRFGGTNFRRNFSTSNVKKQVKDILTEGKGYSLFLIGGSLSVMLGTAFYSMSANAKEDYFPSDEFRIYWDRHGYYPTDLYTPRSDQKHYVPLPPPISGDKTWEPNDLEERPVPPYSARTLIKYGLASQRKEFDSKYATKDAEVKMYQVFEMYFIEGKRSKHPWFPTERKNLDDWLSLRQKPGPYIPLLPPRAPKPYARPLTIIIDANVLMDPKLKVKRPFFDNFLASVQQKYEIVLYSESLQALGKMDLDGRYSSFFIGPEAIYDVPFYYFKNLYAVGRPIESTLMVDSNAESVYCHPDNALIVDPWDGEDLNDNKLLYLARLLDVIATTAAESELKVTIPDIVPHYQDIEKDATQITKEIYGKIERKTL